MLHRWMRLAPGPDSLARLRSVLTATAAVALLLAALIVANWAPGASGSASSRPIEADMLFRLGSLVESVAPIPAQAQQARLMVESAVAIYERQALGERPNRHAILRLGVIYSKRGYLKQGRGMFEQAAHADEANAPLYLLLSYVYDRSAPPVPAAEADVSRLQAMDPWLAAYVLPDYYDRIGLAAESSTAQQQWKQRQLAFGAAIGAIGGLWMLLALGGFVLILLAFVRGLSGRGGRQAGAVAPPRPPLRVPWTLITAVEVLFAVAVLRLLVSVGTGYLLRAFPALRDSDVAVALLVAGGYLLYLGTIGLWIVMKARTYAPDPLRLLGLRVAKPAMALVYGLVGYAVWAGAAVLGVMAAKALGMGAPGTPPTQRAVDLVGRTHSPAALAIYFALIVIVGPLLEELLFRGFLYPGLRTKLTPVVATVVSAALFAGLHVPFAVSQMVAIGAIGIMLAILYERTRSLLPCVVAHSLHNGFVFALLLAQAVL
jgi:membrane protease YdiL (CAAX protease family)